MDNKNHCDKPGITHNFSMAYNQSYIMTYYLQYNLNILIVNRNQLVSDPRNLPENKKNYLLILNELVMVNFISFRCLNELNDRMIDTL